MNSDLSSVNSAQQKPATPARTPEPVSARPGAVPHETQAPVPHVAAKPAVQADPALMQKKLAEAIDHLNEMAQRNNYNLNFSVDHQSHQVVVRVRDTKNGEIIRQMPNEAALRMAQHLSDLKGLFNDEKI